MSSMDTLAVLVCVRGLLQMYVRYQRSAFLIYFLGENLEIRIQ